tara:strand:+ start:1459 stop:2229 length:771 start_codon:yes stop_codon:yes gene_type:complete
VDYEMNERFDILERIIKEKCGKKPIYYLPNSGNWGDSLIRHGTIKFLNDKGIKYKVLSKKKRDWIIPRIRGGNLLYGGGGGWCNLWNHSQEYVNKYKKWLNVIVLPSTYESDYSDSSVTFFSRDLYESKDNIQDSIFCHDMAFYIQDDFYTGEVGSGEGYFFRTDSESSNMIALPDNNFDLSLMGKHTTDVTDFFNEINNYKVIYTDRLHVAIAGCLLKKEVHMYLGSYFKSKAVYLSSINKRFDNVTFHENFDTP